jgi:hypothetical protein
MESLVRRLERTDRLYRDLVATLTPELLRSELGGLPSNAIGGQLWCVVGARESYARAARAGSWQGFTCQLTAAQVADPGAILQALESTRLDVVAVAREVAKDDSPAGEFLFDLLEHEAQHHGQLIRYLYALGIERPDSWKERYALT